MDSLGSKKVGADQVPGPEFLASSTFSSFRIDRYSFQQSFKCNAYEDKDVLVFGKLWGHLEPRAPNWHSLPCNSNWPQV